MNKLFCVIFVVFILNPKYTFVLSQQQRNTDSNKTVANHDPSNSIFQGGLEMWIPLKYYEDDGRIFGLNSFVNINLFKQIIFLRFEAGLLLSSKISPITCLEGGGNFKIITINKKNKIFGGFSLGVAIPSNKKDWGNILAALDLKYLYEINKHVGVIAGFRMQGLLIADKEHGYNPYITLGFQFF